MSVRHVLLMLTMVFTSDSVRWDAFAVCDHTEQNEHVTGRHWNVPIWNVYRESFDEMT